MNARVIIFSALLLIPLLALASLYVSHAKPMVQETSPNASEDHGYGMQKDDEDSAIEIEEGSDER